MQLANAIAPLFPTNDALQSGLNHYVERYQDEFARMTCAKFGFEENTDAAQAIIAEGYALLQECQLDHTRFFRALGDVPDMLPDGSPATLLGDVSYDDVQFEFGPGMRACRRTTRMPRGAYACMR